MLSLIKEVSIFLLKSVVINSTSVDMSLSVNKEFIVLCRFIKVDFSILVVIIVVGMISHSLISKLNSQQLRAFLFFIISSLWQTNIIFSVYLNVFEISFSLVILNILMYMIFLISENILS